MLSKISLLTVLAISVFYPLCFLVSARDPLKNNFHRFHLGLPAVLAGVVLFFLVRYPLAFSTTPDGYLKEIANLHVAYAVVWVAVLMLFSCYYWSKPYPNPYIIVLPCLIGLKLIWLLGYNVMRWGLDEFFSSVLGALVLCSCLFAMNLGHWYLNVHGLSQTHLRRASYAFWWLVGLRILWDVYILFQFPPFEYRGNFITLSKFLFTYDGFFLWIAILFGLVFPFVSMFFVKGTLDVKNTQSTTGILYVILGSVLIGDMTFKYYLIKYGIPL